MQTKVNLTLAYILLVINLIALVFEIYIVMIDGGPSGYGYYAAILTVFIHATLIPALITIFFKKVRSSTVSLVINILSYCYLLILYCSFVKY